MNSVNSDLRGILVNSLISIHACIRSRSEVALSRYIWGDSFVHPILHLVKVGGWLWLGSSSSRRSHSNLFGDLSIPYIKVGEVYYEGECSFLK